MPGEQLTCVLQLAHAKYGDTLLKRSMVSDILSIVNSYQCLCYTEEELIHELSDNVSFLELKNFIYSKRDESTTKREISDQIELTCWRKLYEKTHGKRVADPFESDRFKLWQIFNILAEEESYPPVISQQDSVWIIEKFASYQNSHNKRPQSERCDLTYPDFLNYLANNVDTISIIQATTEIHEWLVKEVIESGWVYIKCKRQHNWSVWSRKWMTLSPGKMLLSSGEISKYPVVNTKSVFYISEQTQRKIVENKGKKHIILITNAKSFECYIETTEENEMHSWLKAFNISIKHYEENTSSTKTILKRQSGKGAETMHGPYAQEREISFHRSISRRNARRKAKDDEESVTQQRITRGRLLRMNSVNTERDKIKAVFLELDKNGNGYLEQKEFFMTLKELGLDLSDSEKKEIFTAIDDDGDRKISFKEFYDYFLEHILNGKDSELLRAFKEADIKKRGAINFREFSNFVRHRNRTISLEKILSTFDKCKDDRDDKLSFQDFMCMSFLLELDIFPDSNAKFEALLKSQFDSTNREILNKMIEKRWKKFDSLKRRGANGDVVMKGGGKVIADVLPGVVNMEDIPKLLHLNTFKSQGANGDGNKIVDHLVPGEYNRKDLLPIVNLPNLLPKRTIIKKVSWKSNNNKNSHGSLIFPFDFNGVIEVEVATSELLGYYGCTFAEDGSGAVCLPYHEAVMDFYYKDNYLDDFVKIKTGAGLESHEFSHIDCPLDDDSGYFVLAKKTKKNLHITAFKIPRRRILYIPGNCIHTNDYLKGTWRTMLSDGSDIDHVHLKRTSGDGGGTRLQPFSFSFSS